ILIAGGGAVAAAAFAEVRALAESLAIPVLTSLAGRGAIPDDHPLSVGGLGAHRNPLSKRLLGEADVALGVGTRFEEMETNWRPGFVPALDARYIQIDINAAEIGRSVPAAIGIVGDARAALADILGAVERAGKALPAGAFQDHPRVKACAAERAAIAADIEAAAAATSSPIHPLRVMRAVRKVFPREATVAIDVGCLAQHMAGSAAVFPVYEPRALIVPSSFYGMGFAASALPVARIARPDQPAVGFVGDGSFQMILHVLPVAAEYELAVTWCVLNDYALGSIRDFQEYALGNRVLDTDFKVQPDFARVAQACGCYGERVREPGAVEAALARALAENRKGVPAVLDFIVARERMQQTYEHYPFYGKA
ncbi:MAG TPA: thiamine pyrophosphate-dependent enzyme, partial [Xanthobacteraceae bacterium]